MLHPAPSSFLCAEARLAKESVENLLSARPDPVCTFRRVEWHYCTDCARLYPHGWQTRVLRRCARVCAVSVRPQRASALVTVTRVSLTDIMLSTEPTEQTRDLAMAIAAIDRKPSSSRGPTEPPAKRKRPRRKQRSQLAAASSTQRALAIVALGALLIGGVTVLTSSTGSHSGFAYRSNAAVDNARSGDCLSWPKDSPGEARAVSCAVAHLFEVASSVDMRDSQQPCQLAVQRYLGSRYDPDGRFTIGVLWSGASTGPQSGDRHLLCGLQLPGRDGKPIAFMGKVAELDQSKVWPAGTCLGIEPTSGQPTGIPVDCSVPHAEEITGAANLAEPWPGAPPAQADEDAFIRDACTRATDAYLWPIALDTTGLTMIYNTVPLASWNAGSRQASCGIRAPLGDPGSAMLIDSAKGRLLINGVPVNTPEPSPPPTIASSPSPPPTTTSSPSPSPTTTSSPSPSPTTTSSRSPTTTPSPSPTTTPSPSPSPSADPDAPQVIEIPGLGPFTLPILRPPPPPPPGE
jgi:putative regulator of septum formation